jgi:predicted dehydrogenase
MRHKHARPRVAFVGLGWIGRHRMQAVVEKNLVDVVAIADCDAGACAQARALAPAAAVVASFEEALALRPDGVVLATPSGGHATQCIAALDAGVAVFCQKPLGRHAGEVLDVIAAARRANRLLGVDVSYRHTDGLSRLRALVREGAIGRIFAVDLVFHNAYGPDKPWFYDLRQSGGGCLLDLGVHLVDFLHWTFDAPPVRVSGQLYAGGRRVTDADQRVEDFALGEIELADGLVARLACSWRVSMGRDAVIGVSLFGTEGGLGFRNVNGSFYDFVAECYRGTETQELSAPPDAWGGRAAVAWVQQLTRSSAFDPAIEIAGGVAITLDRLYGRPQTAASSGRMLIESTR